LFKLAQGEFIAPSHIENLLIQAEFVDQIYIYGDILRSFLVAIIVPSQALQTWAKTQNFTWTNLRELYDKPQITQAILSQVAQVGRTARVRCQFHQFHSLPLTLLVLAATL